MALLQAHTQVAATAACVCLFYGLRMILRERNITTATAAPEPTDTARLPYPPDLFPGARTVATPYGRIHVFEWGPVDGDKVLLVPGASTPVLALGNVADALVARGCRVMMFDLFGRGWSDGLRDLPYDGRMYTAQMLLVLASSPLAWTVPGGFHLLGYSLGGGLVVQFARYLPHLVRSLTLVAPGGLLRRQNRISSHGSWPLLRRVPAWLQHVLVRRYLLSEPVSVIASERRPDVTVNDAVAWQMDTHPGFVHAFVATLQDAPIYDQDADWAILGERLREARAARPAKTRGKVLLVLGAADAVVPAATAIPDAQAVLSADVLDVLVLEGGHDVVMTQSFAIVDAMIQGWAV